MIAYKLFRLLKSGEITSLFINKTERLQKDKWYKAESYPTNGYIERPFWHCTAQPHAPHLSEKDRVWLKVEMLNYIEFEIPKSQGGMWYLAKNIKILTI
jgi:hypothetical protein